MAKQIDIRVSAEAVRDAKTKEGNPTNFQNGISALLDGGYVVAVEDGNNQRTFTDSTEFGQWCNGTAECLPSEYPCPANDNPDGRYQAIMDVPPYLTK
jgi:hypothetical protein